MNREFPQPEPELEPDPWAAGNYGPRADPLPPGVADSMTRWALTRAEAEAARQLIEAGAIGIVDVTAELAEPEAEAEWELEL